MPFTVEFTDANFQSQVFGSKLPVVVHFCATWCGAREMIGAELEEIAEEMRGMVTIGKLDFDKNPSTAVRNGILRLSIPTLILIKDGKLVSSKIGAASITISELRNWITEAI